MVVVGAVTDREFFSALMRGVDVDAFLASSLWERPAWQAEGTCRTQPDLDWLAEMPRDAAAARSVCIGCPVRRECLTHALEFDEVGVWGGTTDLQREGAREVGWTVEELLAETAEVVADGKPCRRCGELSGSLSARGYCAECAHHARRAARSGGGARARAGRLAAEQARRRDLGLRPLAPWATV